jgi:hypothetical protein
MRAITVLASLLIASCSQPPALITDARKGEILLSLHRELALSVEAEKSAVLAITDEDSERFAAKSRKAAQQVDQLRAELRGLVSNDERGALDAFDAAWAKMAQIDAKLLTLATANTNLKAAKLSANDAAQTLDVVLEALNAAQALSKDPERLRELATASVAALRVQTLHAPHIASSDDAEMTLLETRVHALERQVDVVLAPNPARKTPESETQSLLPARQAWSDYKALTEKIFGLSRQNTNVLSFAISIHEKGEATVVCETALQSLAAQVHHGQSPTR